MKKIETVIVKGILESIAWDTRTRKINILVNKCKIADCLEMRPCFLHELGRVMGVSGIKRVSSF